MDPFDYLAIPKNIISVVTDLSARVRSLENRSTSAGSLSTISDDLGVIRTGTLICGDGDPFGVGDLFSGTAIAHPSIVANSANWSIAGFDAGVLNFGLSADDGTLYAQNAYIAGTIYASAGQIGGFTIQATYLALDTGVDATSAGMSPSDYPFYSGAIYVNRATAPFRVSAAGALVATSGSIGGWTIQSAYLARNTGVDATSAGMAPADYPFYSGAVYANRATAPFRVTTAGAMFASGATISGAITATSGFIGGWTIAANTLSSGSLTFNSATPAILMGSATNYLTGTGVFLGQHSSVYKYHVGNPSANYLSWDGTFLVASGQWIRAAGLNPSLTQWSTNIVFSSASDTQVNWSAGTIAMQMSGLTYAISAGNTGAMAALTYIYLDLAVSTTALQTTSTYSTAVGDGKILVAAAQNATNGASVIPYGGQQPLVNGGTQITALSILAGNVAAGAITASKISVTNLQAINATMGSLTIDATLTMSGASSNIRIGTTPPTGTNNGTGLWIDRTGVYSLTSNVQQATLTSAGLSAGAGNVILNAGGLYLVVPTASAYTSSVNFTKAGVVTGTLEVYGTTGSTSQGSWQVNTSASGTNDSANSQNAVACLAKAGYVSTVRLVAHTDSDNTVQIAVVSGTGQGIYLNDSGQSVSTYIKTLNDDYAITVAGSTDRVGIGAPTPAAKLHIYAAPDNNVGLLKIEASSGNNAGLSLWTAGGSTMRNWQVQNNYAAAGGLSIMVSTTNTGNPTTNVMELQGDGKVGIGFTGTMTSLLTLGTAGTLAGTLRMAGGTSGNVTLAVAAAAGTWTMTFPTGNGTAGQQLQTDGAGVTSWAAAASLRAHKDIIGLSRQSPNDALAMIVNTPVYDFTYKSGMGTGDSATIYTGVMADEAAWAMHHDGQIVNPVNTLGYMILGMQALQAKIDDLEQQISDLTFQRGNG